MNPLCGFIHFNKGYFMLTIQSLFPKIDLTMHSYEDDFCFFGESDHKIYFISKLDTTIIIYDNICSKLLTFIDEILVDKRRRFRKLEPIIQEKDLEFLQKAYKNDCCTHFGKDISKKIRHFMKYVRSYDLRIFDMPSVHNDTKFIFINDEIDKIQYKAIVRDNEIYFNNPKKEHSIIHSLFINKFKFRGYDEYTSPDGKVINIFQTYSRIIEAYYCPQQRCYLIDGKRDIQDYDFDGSSIFFKRIENVDYDETFIFNFIFETEIINEPLESFLNKLAELSIINVNEKLTMDHINMYEMVMI